MDRKGFDPFQPVGFLFRQSFVELWMVETPVCP